MAMTSESGNQNLVMDPDHADPDPVEADLDARAAASPDPSSATSRRRSLLTALAASLLALIIGFGVGVLVGRPDYPDADSPEAGFLRDMSVHHGQAVTMGMTAYQRAATQEVRQVGYDIATTQQAQIGIMRAWLDTWEVPLTGDEPAMSWMPEGMNELLPDGRMPGMASNEELAELSAAEGTDVDILFCQLMITHHIAGVHMAQEILRISDQPDVIWLAEQIVSGQQSEIDLLTRLLNGLGASPR